MLQAWKCNDGAAAWPTGLALLQRLTTEGTFPPAFGTDTRPGFQPAVTASLTPRLRSTKQDISPAHLLSKNPRDSKYKKKDLFHFIMKASA